MYLDRKEEYRQIFKEGWRNQRDYLYVPNMHGADWNKMEEMYGQMLPWVNHRADLNYLLDTMGERNMTENSMLCLLRTVASIAIDNTFPYERGG